MPIIAGSSSSTGSNHGSVVSQYDWKLVRSSAIDQLAIAAVDPHSTNPTDDRAHCSPDEVRPGSVTVWKVGRSTPQSPTDGQLRALVHSTPVLSTNESTGAFESATPVLGSGGWRRAQARFSPGLHFVDQMTSHKHSTFDLDDQLQTNAPPSCPSAHIQHCSPWRRSTLREKRNNHNSTTTVDERNCCSAINCRCGGDECLLNSGHETGFALSARCCASRIKKKTAQT